MHRRKLLQALAACGALLAPRLPYATLLKPLGEPQPFDYAWLKGRARALAAAPYQPPPDTLPAALAGLDYDQYQSIRFRPDHALWGEEKRRFRVQLYQPGRSFKRPVQIHEVVDGRAQQLAYDPEMFDYGKSGVVGASLPSNLGFAGLHINFHTAWNHDIASFLGASYFRATGGSRQYGLSARGLAVDTGLARAEEFPDFVAFWLERPQPQANTVVLYALLDSPSIAGAYRIAITPGDTLLMEVDSALYPRVPIERLGIAPGTSMFQIGENDRRVDHDWRAEIHDSDGLSMCSGTGEWIWRPLGNPPYLRFSSFTDRDPRGFGLLQRDRVFDHYQDDGANYERRPSLWVEPRGGWGAGSVQLIEIPTIDETFDNIIAFWNPAEPLPPQQERLYSYRLYWGEQMPQVPLARCIATRTGLGGIVGQKRRYWSARFVVDFVGGDLPMVDARNTVEPVITASRGTVELTSARPLAAVNGYRAMFDLRPDASTEPITLRLFLRAGGQPLSETWIYTWDPPPPAERKLFGPE